MPRPRKADLEGKEVKKRSRNGCWPCKSRKVKCGEEKPACLNCTRQGESCDYSIRLNWDGRSKKKDDDKNGAGVISFAPEASTMFGTATSPQGIPEPGAKVEIPPLSSYTTQNVPSVQHHPPAQDTTLPPITNFPGSLPLPNTDFNPGLLPTPPFRAPSWNEPSKNPGSFPAPMIGPRGSISMPAYPSPQDSNFGSPGIGGPPYNNNLNGYSSMPPPMPTSNPLQYQDSVSSSYNSAKRVRLSPQNSDFGNNTSLLHRSYSAGVDGNNNDGPRVHFRPNTPTFFQPYPNNPLTPAASTQNDDDRRISVSSLLSEDPEPPSKRSSGSEAPPTSHPVKVEPPSRRGSLHQRMISYSETETYGHDRGLPDFDIPRNNDANAISEQTPSEHSEFSSWLDAEFEDPSFGFGTGNKEQVFAAGGYYASPVPIKISRKLEPLPNTLIENPMNLLYFHHFLNHTAKILVPHDCPENPFKTILPKMAVENPNLLNLMLAYSASHRARLLNHHEPANRIAVWVRDVFPSLRETLNNVSNTAVSNANLATAIMLASLEIISPSSFGVSIPWQNHLSIARSIIRSRCAPHSISRKDPVMFFLTRWMAYLDVMGSLSGRRNEEPLFAGNYWSNSAIASTPSTTKELSLDDDDTEIEDEDDYTIDCLLGFTTKCVSILAQVALLVRECEPQRIDQQTGRINTDWRPGPDIAKRAEKLKADLQIAMEHEQKSCSHHSPQMAKSHLAHGHNHDTYPAQSQLEYPERRYSTIQMSPLDALESLNTNTAFHYAGLIHLLRRVSNLPRSHPNVQTAVHSIVNILSTIREGGSAEACLLFPMITAGMEAEGDLDRAVIKGRIKGAEGLGMCQVVRARKVMEEVWASGESWEVVGQGGEFFG